MNTDQEIIMSAKEMLEKHLDVHVAEKNIVSREALIGWLSAHIVYMLQHEMEKLLQLLYRIDVNEKKVKEAFAQSNPAMIAPTIAVLILDRELQKAKSRLAHKNKDVHED
jgi:hypothetical protein